jgi:hypothetical protein
MVLNSSNCTPLNFMSDHRLPLHAVRGGGCDETGIMKLSGMRNSLGPETGTEIAEAALVLPIMFLVLLGIYYFGLALSTYETINHAAMEAARVAAFPTCATCSLPPGTQTTLAGNAAQQVMQSAGLDPTRSTELVETLTPCGTNTLACEDPFTFGGPHMCVYYNVLLNATGPQACGVYVSLQYPYTFYLPFSSLNQQAIQLKARVQFRGEY